MFPSAFRRATNCVSLLPFAAAQPSASRSYLRGSQRVWQQIEARACLGSRDFTTSRPRREDGTPGKASEKAEERPEKKIITTKSSQRKVNDRPWQRISGMDSQPEATSPDPSNGDMTKGRLLTTPTRLLKLILPMPFHPDQEHINPTKNEAKKLEGGDHVEPLALLVHPQQPLSYLERLIQAEIPPMLVKGREKLPDIIFRAEADQVETETNGRKSDSNIASYSGLGREGPQRDEANWVRWSGSTEVGDFIRDAARGKEFAIDIEGHSKELRVAVPSFKDRTHYMRMRLRRMSHEIESLAKIKSECDLIAHKGAHRIAQGGFAALAGWWAVVYYVTFHTDAGWDLVEPVTYLAGLATIMGGYLWFLYISKDLSYKAAMNLTVSRRQNALYQEKGLDLQKWEMLVQEANHLRRDIKIIAAEYDVDWDEMKDLGGQEVKEVLEKEKEKSGKKQDEEEEGEEEEEEEGGEERKQEGNKSSQSNKQRD